LSVTAVENGNNEGKKIMAIMGKPNPIFACRKAPTNTMANTLRNNTAHPQEKVYHTFDLWI
jgi:hypothetical protein